MKLLRLSIAILILRGAGVVVGLVAGPALAAELPPRKPLHPAERILLGSIAGLATWAAFIWISVRAGQ